MYHLGNRLGMTRSKPTTGPGFGVRRGSISSRRGCVTGVSAIAMGIAIGTSALGTSSAAQPRDSAPSAPRATPSVVTTTVTTTVLSTTTTAEPTTVTSVQTSTFTTTVTTTASGATDVEKQCYDGSIISVVAACPTPTVSGSFTKPP